VPVNILVRDEPSSLAEVRAAVDTIAAELGLSAEAAFDLKVATGEALANALRRAGNNEVAVDVTLESDPDVIAVEVVDGGRFRIDEGSIPSTGAASHS
jgi:anti-sigma regulatory factor (Ser/Thr protein kinase)